MKNILIHLRIPFSFFLMPVYLFALSQTQVINSTKAWWVFFILHALVFPSSNVYNSYHDKDEGSIGLIEKPPPVTKSLLLTANVLDLLAIVLGFFFVSMFFMGYLVAYILVSRAYSNPLIRLKKRPIISWLAVCVFQGAFTYLAVCEAFTSDLTPWTLDATLTSHYLLPALICTSNLLAIYPLTQVYQHTEDAARGDLTMSRVLGVRGTFVNAFVWLGASAVGYWFVFDSISQFLLLSAFMFPVVVFLTAWSIKVWSDDRYANFRFTMWCNLLASSCLNIFFGVLYFTNH
jgi:UbiA prenyltransferase family